MDKENDPKLIFTHIYETNFWGSQESRSGQGSEVVRTRHLRRELQVLLSDYQIKSVLDLPCGDFNWMRLMDLTGIDYLGADIVDAIIAGNTEKYTTDNIHFKVMNLLSDDLPKVDLIICRDCLFHFPNAMVTQALANIQRSGSKYFLTTQFTWRGLECNADIPLLGGGRRITLECAPFNLPRPIREIIEGNDEGWQEDRTMGLWKNDLCRDS